MNYKSFNLGDWISHISGAIEDERELDGNEMRDLVEFLSKLQSMNNLYSYRCEEREQGKCPFYYITGKSETCYRAKSEIKK